MCVCVCVCVCVGGGGVHWWLSGIHSELPIERLVIQGPASGNLVLSFSLRNICATCMIGNVGVAIHRWSGDC